jgi:hypothetical protein
MADDEIPCADFKEEPKEEVKLTPYEEQKKLCLKEIKKLNEFKSSVSFVFYQNPDDKLIKELEEKKYHVKYNLYYDKKYTCSMTITNPKFVKEGDNNVNEMIKDFSVSLGGDGEKLIGAFKELFKQF